MYKDGELFYEDRGILYSVSVLDAKNDYYRVTKYTEGIKRYSGEFKNEKLNGKWFVWYEDGSLQHESDMVNGKEHGNSIWYFKNGDLMSKKKFISGIEVPNTIFKSYLWTPTK